MWGVRTAICPVHPGLPEHYHQINAGQKGLQALNAPPAKKRRFLFSNEGSL
jgi:hypothetical protein